MYYCIVMCCFYFSQENIAIFIATAFVYAKLCGVADLNKRHLIYFSGIWKSFVSFIRSYDLYNRCAWIIHVICHYFACSMDVVARMTINGLMNLTSHNMRWCNWQWKQRPRTGEASITWSETHTHGILCWFAWSEIESLFVEPNRFE